eukprot:3404720-Amphidinium_carterae.1
MGPLNGALPHKIRATEKKARVMKWFLLLCAAMVTVLHEQKHLPLTCEEIKLIAHPPAAVIAIVEVQHHSRTTS